MIQLTTTRANPLSPSLRIHINPHRLPVRVFHIELPHARHRQAPRHRYRPGVSVGVTVAVPIMGLIPGMSITGAT